MDIGIRFRVPRGEWQWVLRDVNLCCGPGEFIGILGPSGCGKSTLLRIVAGLQTPSAGTLSFRAEDGPDVVERPRISFVFQSPNLLPWRDVLGNVSVPLQLTDRQRDSWSDRINAVTRLVGLKPLDVHKLPRQLSGGMQMRVSLARALVTQPQIMLLDEPFSALDEMMRQQLNDELRQLQSTQGWTTLFVTHNVSEAVYLADRIVVLGKTGPENRTVLECCEVPWSRDRPSDLRVLPVYHAHCADVARQLREVTRRTLSD